MQSYRLALPPKAPGIYVLKNSATKQIYVGQTGNLHRRISEWRSVANGSFSCAPSKMRNTLNLSDVENWDFVVVCEMPNASKEDLRVAEEKMIAEAKEKFGNAVINVAPPVREEVIRGTAYPGVSATALTTITYRGEVIPTYREAAEILGVERSSLIKQVAGYRAKGQNQLTIEYLQSRKRRA